MLSAHKPSPHRHRPAEGLYDPQNEHDACGVAFVATLTGQASNDIVVKGNLISRLHARVEASRDRFTLIDESTNGTFVQTSDGEEIFVRRDNTLLTGAGVIGLGRVAQPNTPLAIHYVVED